MTRRYATMMMMTRRNSNGRTRTALAFSTALCSNYALLKLENPRRINLPVRHAVGAACKVSGRKIDRLVSGSRQQQQVVVMGPWEPNLSLSRPARLCGMWALRRRATGQSLGGRWANWRDQLRRASANRGVRLICGLDVPIAIRDSRTVRE